MTPTTHPRARARGRSAARIAAAAATGTALVAASLLGATAASAVSLPRVDPTNPDFGPNVTIFTPSTPLAEVQTKLTALGNQQRNDEMGTNRQAVYFTPGQYGTQDHPLQFTVGYYTEVAGLGLNPDDVTLTGSVESYNRCLENNGTSNCLALDTFWRTISNFALHIDKAGQDGCRQSANFWAVSQAVSMRRLDISGANVSLMDYCSAGPQYASGGYIADSKLPFVVSGSQQQWLTRNSDIAGWSNGVWNQVFAGVNGAPAETFPTPNPYTVVDKTPISREKPYLYIDGTGKWNVRVPSAATNTSGTTWANGVTPGRSIPITDFFIAKPSDSVQVINNALSQGKNLLLTPGVYSIDQTIKVKHANTVVLGMGHATLTSVGGATPLEVANVDGAIVAGVTLDAGTVSSPYLLQVGKPGNGKKMDAANPITLNDVYIRVGGPHVGKVQTAVQINADNVLVDHTWVWRADHGVEGFTNGVNGDTDRWNTNTADSGFVVNGANVTATGLFVEHFQKYNVVWNGNGGRTIMFQNELAYDPPTQADWTQPDGTLGYPGYVVGKGVTTHELDGGGVYVFNQNNPSIVTANGFSVPETPGVVLNHIMTVNLAAGTIQHVVNGVGGQADNSNTGQPRFVVRYPAP